MNSPTTAIRKKDLIYAAFIGFSFGLFSIPILKNINLPFIQLSPTIYLMIVIFFTLFAIFAIWIASLLGRVLPVAFQVAKFSAIGAFNTFLDWGILGALIAMTGIATGLGFSAFKSFSFVVANIASYFWNKHWAFESKQKSVGKEFGVFFLVSVIGMLINVTSASLIVHFKIFDISPERLASVGAAIATVASLIWNFLGYKFIVFKK